MHLLDTRQQAPLHWAAGIGNEEIVDILVKAGGDLLLEDRFGRTAFDEAIYCEQMRTACYIIENYPDTYKDLLPKWPTDDDFDLRNTYALRRGMLTRCRNY